MQKIKELELQQHNMQEAIRKNQELDRRRQEAEIKAIEDKARAENRGKNAIIKQKEIIEIVSNEDKIKRNVEQKQKVKELENQFSKAMAEEFRQKEKQRQAIEEIQKREEANRSVYSIDKFGNKIDN